MLLRVFVVHAVYLGSFKYSIAVQLESQAHGSGIGS